MSIQNGTWHGNGPTITVNVIEGTSREEWYHRPMIVSKKHRPATKTI